VTSAAGCSFYRSLAILSAFRGAVTAMRGGNVGRMLLVGEREQQGESRQPE